MASIPISGERFDMGRVVSRAFGVIARNFVLFLGLTLLLSTLPSLLTSAIAAWLNPISTNGFYFSIIVGSLVSAIGGYVLTGALSYVTVSDLNNGSPSFGKALGIGLRYAFPLLGLAILSILGIYAGLLFLIVPGMILAVMWSVSAPAMVTEQLGVTDSLGRSRALTKGSRWPIFGLLMVAVVIVLVPLMLASLVSGAFESPQAGAVPTFGLSTILQAVFGAGSTMILIAIVAAIYVELRTIKEGASSESLASIFA